MKVLVLAEWYLELLLLVVLLFRAYRRRLLREFPVFYAYIGFVLCSSIVFFSLSTGSPQAYAIGYWISEFISAWLGVGIIWEIYGSVLRAYAGVYRLGRSLISALSAFAVAGFAFEVVTRPLATLIRTIVELERNLRFMQALLLLVILALILYYRVPLGRNIGCLFCGYGLFIASAVGALALRSALGSSFQSWWKVFQPSAYFVTLMLWCAGLWTKSASPVRGPSLERDYESVSRETIGEMARLRTRIEGVLHR